MIFAVKVEWKCIRCQKANSIVLHQVRDINKSHAMGIAINCKEVLCRDHCSHFNYPYISPIYEVGSGHKLASKVIGNAVSFPWMDVEISKIKRRDSHKLFVDAL